MKNKEIYVKIIKDGPYLIYGVSNIAQKTIITDENGFCINYGDGKCFEIKSDTAVLCRCGKSKNPPFCDGSHICTNFNGTETASFEPILNNVVNYEGVNLNLADSEIFCASARFCDANGGIWNLIATGNAESDQDAIRESKLCPSGRLLIFDKEGNLIDDELPQSVSLIEDTGLKISGPLWLQGKIRVESANGKSYEIRNRQTLCRCGKSKNKPFCDSTHCHTNFEAEYK